MDFEIIEADKDSIRSENLARFSENPSLITKYYVARNRDLELGIISIDQYKSPLPLFVYFLFVERPYRNRGIGTYLLEFAEQMAISRGNPSIVLQPHEVESDVPLQELTKWYMRKGYSWRENDSNRMEKPLD